LLAEFGTVAGLDPVSRRFGDDPRRLQRVQVARDYAAAPLQPVGDYLERYRVRHLMLCGAASRQGGLAWLTLYREDHARPFDGRAAALAGFAVPFALLAGREGGLPEAAEGRGALSPREREVAAAYAAGEGYKGIARNLGLSPATVRSHLLAIFRKLEVHNKIELRRRLGLA
jgi:DNA-binding CsgD family transcriptional regulator